MKQNNEPTGINYPSANYIADVTRAFSWYNYEKDKKDARQYLKSYIGREKAKLIDRVPDRDIILTFGWMARMLQNGCVFSEKDTTKLNDYIIEITANDRSSIKYEPVIVDELEESPVTEKPNIRDFIEDKMKAYIGELEGVTDDIFLKGIQFDLYKDMQARNIPAQYCTHIDAWIKRKAGQYIGIYESDLKDVREAYDNLGRRKITGFIKTLSVWLADVERYGQFKKANRKPKVRKVKPAGVQVAKMSYKKEDTTLGLKSINPVEIIGANQVWVYNTRLKKIACYRSDSKDGIQVKGTTLQNYDPAQCEQKTLRNPKEIIEKVLGGGKLILRKLISELPQRDHPVTGRINDECIILRAIR
jgi:hypothetical protein